MAALFGLAEGGVRVAERLEDLGGAVGVAEVAEQGKSLVVAVDGLGVVTAVVVDVAEHMRSC